VDILKITLYLKGPLKKYGDHLNVLEVEISDKQAKVQAVIEKFKVPASSISFIQVDGEKANLDTVLRGGEVVVVNPRVAGG